MGFADINSLIKFRDAKPGAPIKAVFMLYNRPPFAVIGRKSRGIVSAERSGRQRRSAHRQPTVPIAQWPIFVQANGIDRVQSKNRERQLPGARADAGGRPGRRDYRSIHSTTFVDLKDKGVPVDDIAVLLMADYGVELYGKAIIVNSKFAAEHPDAVKGFLRCLHERPEGNRKATCRRAIEFGAQTQYLTRGKTSSLSASRWRSVKTSSRRKSKRMAMAALTSSASPAPSTRLR